MPRSIADKTIIITGASSGIGAATAVRCGEAGMRVVLNARRADRLEAVRAEVEARGGAAAVVPGDVADPAVTEALLDAAERQFDGCHAVFANAGYGMDKAVLEMTSVELRRMFDVNLFASVHLLQDAARRMIDRSRHGHLLMCSSCLAKFTLAGHAAYSATKAAQNHFCRAMRIELKPHRIEVSSVHPITTRTEFFDVSARESGKEDGAPGLPEHTPALFVQSPDRVARAVVKCLQRPSPEVWTSHTVRATAALMTWSPRLADVLMKRVAARDER